MFEIFSWSSEGKSTDSEDISLLSLFNIYGSGFSDDINHYHYS